MKILLIAGHGAGDSGALGNGYKECDLTRELVNLIAPKLRNYATVDVYDQNRNAFKDVQNGKFNVGKYDYALEIHFNAYSDKNAHGSEMFVTTTETGITVEQAIMKNMKRYFTLRDNDSIFDGVKRTNFLVIKTLKNKGISGALLETCFITNENDMKVYQGNKKGIADDIVSGIVAGFGLKKKEVKETEEQKHQRLVRENAKQYGMKVPTSIRKGQRFWISRYATFYGGAHLGKAIPDKVLKSTDSYTASTDKLLKQKYKGKTYNFVLAKEINSYIRLDEIMVK